MMKCDEFRNDIMAFAEQLLPYDRMEDMKAHIQDCKECAFLAGEFTAIESLIESENAIQPKPFAETRLFAKITGASIQKESVHSISWIGKLKPVWVGLGIFSAVALGITLGYQGQHHTIKQDDLINPEQEIRNDLNVPEFMSEDLITFD